MLNIIKEKISEIKSIKQYGELMNCKNNKYLNYHEFLNNKEADDWGNMYYSEWAKTVKRSNDIAGQIWKDTAFGAFEEYLGYTHGRINEFMRFGLEQAGDERIKATMLLRDMCAAPQIPENIIVYRMVCEQFIHELIENNKENGMKMTEEKGFLSGSLLSCIAESDEPYGRHKNILKLYVPKGTVGVYASTITNRYEYEMLIAPGRAIRMINYPYNVKIKGKLKKVYECEIFNFESPLIFDKRYCC